MLHPKEHDWLQRWNRAERKDHATSRCNLTGAAVVLDREREVPGPRCTHGEKT
jgi:hypothetical protein